MRCRGLLATLVVLVLGAAMEPNAATDAQPTGEAAPPEDAMRPFELDAEKFSYPAPGTIEASGDVTIRAGDVRIQADRVTLRDDRFVEAEGNVVVVWSVNRLAGTRLVYDLEREVGTVEDAVGQVEVKDRLFFQADLAEKVGPDRIELENATVTTCTQPKAYWSFQVSSAKIRLDHYARMRNLRLKIAGVPVFYLPWMAWPVKQDRAFGLLVPRFGSSATRGRIFGQDLFVPLGRSADAKVGAEYYTEAGLGLLGQFRAIPNRRGTVDARGFWIDDRVSGFPRWSFGYQQTQQFENGFRMIADITRISDFDFFADYAREIALTSIPSISARVEFSRNGSWTGLNVRELRREQLYFDGSSLVQRALPQIEWFGRSRRLGSTPLYIAFESSFARLQQQSKTLEADYYRVDLSPTFSAPLSPVPWIDITPSVNVRSTAYSQRQLPAATFGAPVTVVDDPLYRNVAGGGIEIVGPKLFRIYEPAKGRPGSRYKSTLQPRLAYAWQQGFDETGSIIPYDAVDVFIGDVNQAQYGVTTQLLVRRPRQAHESDSSEGERILLAEGSEGRTREATPDAAGHTAPAEPAAAPPSEPVQILSFTVQQRYAFDRLLTFADTDEDGVIDDDSKFSDVDLSGRYSPGDHASLDLRSTFSPLYRKPTFASATGTYRNDFFRTSVTATHNVGLGATRISLPAGGFTAIPRPDSTQIRYAGGVTLRDGKIVLDVDGTFNPSPQFSQSRYPDLRVRLQYYTQCCGFLAEYLERDFTTTSRRDFRIAVDLRGIGKLFDSGATALP